MERNTSCLIQNPVNRPISEDVREDFDFGYTTEHEILRCNLIDAIGPLPFRFTFTSLVLGYRQDHDDIPDVPQMLANFNSCFG